ncbi:MAG: hypothetical protein Q8R28_15025 [Dehalococcoidia bacterium]|nr:hypothetical protein [Dehalococcoidia bacterium]
MKQYWFLYRQTDGRVADRRVFSETAADARTLRLCTVEKVPPEAIIAIVEVPSLEATKAKCKHCKKPFRVGDRVLLGVNPIPWRVTYITSDNGAYLVPEGGEYRADTHELYGHAHAEHFDEAKLARLRELDGQNNALWQERNKVMRSVFKD